MLDELSVSLILFLHDNPNSTTTDVAKEIVKDTESNVNELRAMDTKIRQRFKVLEERGIVKKKDCKPALYSIDHSHVTIGREAELLYKNGKNGDTGNGRKISMSIGEFMMVLISDKSIIIRMIGDFEDDSDNS